jgi:hypothetical protein
LALAILCRVLDSSKTRPDKPFSLGGDSGSLIVDGRRRAVAMLFSGNDLDSTLASPINTVLDAFKVDLVY